jgi:LysR family transcriptional activator of nhaA
MQWLNYHRLNYHHLFYFWTVAREGSFTAAAAKLRIAQSAVSFQVQQLEESLGKKLLNRTTSRRLSLTEEGQFVRSQAEEIFRQGRELVETIQSGEVQKSLRLGAFGSLSKNLQVRLLKPILEFDKFEISVDVGDPKGLLDRLRAYHLDFILCDVPYPFSEEEPLIQREIAREPIGFVGRPLERRGGSTKGTQQRLFERLAVAGVFLPARSHTATPELEAFLEKAQQKGHLKIKIRGYVDDVALLRVIALETDSCVALPRIAIERELKIKALTSFYEFRSLHQKFYLVFRQKSPKSEALVQHFKIPFSFPPSKSGTKQS